MKVKQFSQSCLGCVWSCTLIDSSVYLSQLLVSHNLLHQKYGDVTNNTYWSSYKHLTPPTNSVTWTLQGLDKDVTATYGGCLKIPEDILSGHIPVEQRSTMNHTGFLGKVFLPQMHIEETPSTQPLVLLQGPVVLLTHVFMVSLGLHSLVRGYYSLHLFSKPVF